MKQPRCNSDQPSREASGQEARNSRNDTDVDGPPHLPEGTLSPQQRGGQQTLDKHGLRHFQGMAQRAAEVRHEQIQLRTIAMQALIDAGIKIPTIVKFTLADIPSLPASARAAIDAYVTHERPETATERLFVSTTGAKLGVPHAYTVMKHYQQSLASLPAESQA